MNKKHSKQKNKLIVLKEGKWPVWFPILVLIVAGLLAYFNSFQVPFQFDDELHILNRESFHSLDAYRNFSFWLNINERPFSSFTLTLNYLAGKEHVFGYHLVNWLIHLLTAIVIFIFTSSLVNRNEPKSKVLPRWFPLFIALIFLVNPVQTQSVTYIIQRMTSLAGLFYTLSVTLYFLGRVAWLDEQNGKQSVLFLVFSAFAGILAVLSKQTALTFPVAMLLIELFFIRNKNGKICLKYLSVFVISGLLVLVVLLVRFGLPSETSEVSRLSYLLTQMKVIPRYFLMMLFPMGLSIDHGIKMADTFWNWKIIVGTLFILALIVFGFLQYKRNRLVSFGLFWIFIVLSVESSIIPIRDAMFDQRMYLALFGFSLAFWGKLIPWLEVRKPKMVFPLALLVVLGLTIGTITRNNIWQSRIAIWEQVTRRYPDYYRGWLALGKMYKEDEQKNLSKMIEAFEKASVLNPKDDEVWLDLGFYYLRAKRVEEAMACYQRMLTAKKYNDRKQAHLVLASYYLSKKEYDQSIQYFRKLLAEKPDEADALIGLADISLDQNNFPQAKAYLDRVLETDPNNDNALFSLGKVYFYSNERTKAASYLEKSLEINPNRIEAMLLCGNACINIRQYSKAIGWFQKAYAINKDPNLLRYIDFARKMEQGQ